MPTVAQTIPSDTTVIVEGSQAINADTNIAVVKAQAISSNVTIKRVDLVGAIGSDTVIVAARAQTIQSLTTIVQREVDLKLFKETSLSAEVGTDANPLGFGSIEAGDTVILPDTFVLFNDKGGVLQSVDARDVTVSVQQIELVDELAGTSNGAAGQSFTVAFPPIDDTNPLTVKVNDVPWTRVSSFVGTGPTDQVYVANATAGTITFGDGIQGRIPPAGHTVKVSYAPGLIRFGKEVAEQLWIGVQSNGVIANPRAVVLEQVTPTDNLHVLTLHKPIASVSGVFLLTDPHKTGTNFFTGGTFDAASGLITLGTALPDAGDVLVDYSYTIADDAEGAFSQIGETAKHTFASPIPSNNAKKLNFRAVVPATASPSGIEAVRFRLRFEYKE